VGLEAGQVEWGGLAVMVEAVKNTVPNCAEQGSRQEMAAMAATVARVGQVQEALAAMGVRRLVLHLSAPNCRPVV
jgi:hypothetical protein